MPDVQSQMSDDVCDDDVQRQMSDDVQSVDLDNVSGYSTDQDAKNREKVIHLMA